jgi:hypothetical protein
LHFAVCSIRHLGIAARRRLCAYLTVPDKLEGLNQPSQKPGHHHGSGWGLFTLDRFNPSNLSIAPALGRACAGKRSVLQAEMDERG